MMNNTKHASISNGRNSLLLSILMCSVFACEDWGLDQQAFPEMEDSNYRELTGRAFQYELTGEVKGLTPNTLVDNFGHIWSAATNDPTLDDYEGIALQSDGNRDGMERFTFVSETDQLCPDRTYYFKSFSIVNDAVEYSAVEQFRTPALTFSANIRILGNEVTIVPSGDVNKVSLVQSVSGYPPGFEAVTVGFYWGTSLDFTDQCPATDNVRSIDVRGRALPDSLITPYDITFDSPGNYSFQPFIEVCDQIFCGAKQELTIRFPWFEVNTDGVSMTPRKDALAFSIGQRGYVGLGDAGTGFEKDFWVFDAAAGQWDGAVMEYGGSRRFSAAAFVLQAPTNFAFAGFGQDLATLQDLWQYDTNSNSWAEVPIGTSQPPPRRDAVGFAINQKGYIGLGILQQGDSLVYYQDFWEFDPSGNDGRGAWTEVTAFPGEGRFDAVAFSIGDSAYVGTGRGASGSIFKDFWRFDQGQNSWFPVNSVPDDFAARSGAVGFVINGKGYIGTGDDGTRIRDDFWEFNPAANNRTGTWIQRAAFRGGPRTDAVGFSIDGKGYIGTGNDGSSNRNDFWVFDPKADDVK